MATRAAGMLSILALIGTAGVFACSHSTDHRTDPAEGPAVPKSLAGIDRDALGAWPALKLASDPATADDAARILDVEGRLDATDPRLFDGSHFDGYITDVNAGDIIDVTMSSADFVPYLLLVDRTSLETVVEAAGTAGRPARIRFVVPQDGRYVALANSGAAESYGVYRIQLTITRGGPAREVGPPDDLVAAYPGGGSPDGRYALLIGIDDYPEDGSSLDLTSCVTDTRVMRDLLISNFGYRPEDIVVINDAAATRDHIIAAIRRHLGQAGPDGAAFLFYSGHGTRMDGDYGIEDEAVDGIDEALYVWGDRRYSSVILDDEINILLGELAAGTKLAIFDSCNSGTGTLGYSTKFVSLEDPRVKNLLRLPADWTIRAMDAGSYRGSESMDHLLLAACRADEQSLAGPQGWPSVFTMVVVAEVEAGNADLEVSEFMQRVRSSVTAFIEDRLDLDHEQTPQIDGTAEGMTLRQALTGRRGVR